MKKCKTNKIVKVHLNNVITMFIISLIIAFSAVGVMNLFGVLSENLQNSTYIYADNNIDLETVEVVEERIIPIIEENVIQVEKTPLSLEKIGDFRLTAYCPCSICCEKYAANPEGKTTSIGVGAYQGVTFAVDPSKIPYGSKIYVEGVGVGIATDCGGAIKGNRIDVYFSNHEDARAFGVAGGVPHAVYLIQ